MPHQGGGPFPQGRHCPKCQSSAAQRWLDACQADLLPVEYFHVVFTLPAPIADLALHNKTAIYGLLFDVAAEVLLTIAADPKHLGARIGATLVLRTWGSALTHHPHVHGIVPGGGLGPDGKTWMAYRPGFFLSVRVLSRLFRRRFLLHVLPGVFHRIRHDGLLANGSRKTSLALARELLHVPPAQAPAPHSEQAAVTPSSAAPPAFVCRHCGHAMTILQTFMRGELIRTPPPP